MTHKIKILLYVLLLLPAILTISMKYTGTDDLRIFGAPPFFLISLIVIVLFSIKTKFLKTTLDFKSPFFWFIIYINITTIIINPSGVIYSLSWLINYFIYKYYSINNKIFKLKQLDFYIIVSTLTVIAVCKLIFGLDTDGNPYPLLNRNATSTIIIFLFVYYKILYNKFDFLDFLFIFLLIINGSRSSLLAISVFYFLFYFKGFKFKNIFVFTFLFSSIFYALSFNNIAVKRFDAGINFFNQLSKDEVERVGDYERVLLIRSGIQIFNDNMIFGVGEGIGKYQSEFNRIVTGYSRDSRAHNFFITRLANFGIVGFTLFLIGYYYELKSKKYFFISSVTFAIIFFFNEYVLLPQIFLLTGLFPEKISSINKKLGL